MAEDELTIHQEAVATELLQSRPRIVAAIPCFNEDRSIGSVVVKARKYVDSVIVIDDGSTDSTVEVASGAGAVVYRHGQNRGYGAAIRSAVQKGRELQVDVMVILDGDGQHDPMDIPLLIKPVLDGEADVVVGSRFLGKGNRAPLYRRLGQRVLTVATNLTSGSGVSDSQSGFRAYSPKALGALNLTESGMSASSEIQFAIRDSGLRVAEVPIAVSYTDGARRNPFEHGLNVLTRILLLFSLRHPLLLFGAPGICLLAGALALGTRVLTIYSDTSQVAIGNALGTVLLSQAGLLALFTALMLQAMKELLRGGAALLAREMKESAPHSAYDEEKHRSAAASERDRQRPHSSTRTVPP